MRAGKPLEFPLHIDMLYGTVENGEVTGIELDSFTDTDFQLTRGDGEKTG